MRAYWRYTAEPLTFFIVDARALIFLLIPIITWDKWLTIISGVLVLVFSGLAFFNITPVVFGRILRVWIVGPVRTHIPSYRRRHYVR